jgi:hypothetical protein
VIFTDSTVGFWSLDYGMSWNKFTFPTAIREGVPNASGKWVFYGTDFSDNKIRLTTTTDFVNFATVYTQTVTGSSGIALFGGQGIDYDATLNKFAFATWGNNPGVVSHSSTGDTGSWTNSTMAAMVNPYATTMLMGNGYAYVATYGDNAIQYSTNLTSWTKVSGSAEAITCLQSINKANGIFMHGSNNPANYYWSGQANSFATRLVSRADLTGPSWNNPVYIGGGRFMARINTTQLGNVIVYTNTPNDASSWVATTNNLPAGLLRFCGDDQDGWNIVGIVGGVPAAYIATS